MVLRKGGLKPTPVAQPVPALAEQSFQAVPVRREKRQTGPTAARRVQPVFRTGTQLSMFHFHEMGYQSSLETTEQSIQLNACFRKEMFREPMRLLAALPRLSVLERRLYWLVLTALKNYQYLQQATHNAIPLFEERLTFSFHKSALRAGESKTQRGHEVSVVEVKKTLADLAGKTIRWSNAKGDAVYISMFDTQYLAGDGIMVLELNGKLTEAFLKLGNDFAQGTLQKALLLEGQYAQLLYSYLARSRWRGKWQIGLSELRKLLGATAKSYDQYFTLKARVLKIAIDEIKAKTDLDVDFTEVNRTGDDMEVLFTIKSHVASPDSGEEKDGRLKAILAEIDMMSLAEKVQFADSTLSSYYRGFLPWQRELILSDQHVLDRFLRADAYVESGMVNKGKHEAYVATAAFRSLRSPTS